MNKIKINWNNFKQIDKKNELHEMMEDSLNKERINTMHLMKKDLLKMCLKARNNEIQYYNEKNDIFKVWKIKRIVWKKILREKDSEENNVKNRDHLEYMMSSLEINLCEAQKNHRKLASEFKNKNSSLYQFHEDKADIIKHWILNNSFRK